MSYTLRIAGKQVIIKFALNTFRFMDIIEFRDFCLSIPLTEETTPFDEDTLVFKIGGKIYAYTSISRFTWICLKAGPEEIPDLRERYPEIGLPRNMNKDHWISVDTDGDLPDGFIKDLVRRSYSLVIEGMAKSKRAELLAALEEYGL